MSLLFNLARNTFGFKRKEIFNWDSHPELRRLDQSPILDPNGRMRTMYIRLETVNLCNNDCIICAYSDQTRVKERMPQPVFEKALADYAAMGGGYVSLTPLVGDVFMDGQLAERIRYLQQCKFVTGVGFTTNASMTYRFSDDELRAIIAPLQRLSISIYGLDADEYAAMTRRKKYKRMVEGIKRILSVSTAPVSLEFRLLKKRPRGEILQWLETEIGLAEADLGVHPNVQAGRHRAFINSVITIYANWSLFSQETRPLPHDASWSSFEPQEVRPQCLIPLFAFMVFSNGNVSFCACDNYNDVEELRLGNINDDTLSNIYNSETAKSLWNWAKTGVPEFCQSCSFHMPLSRLNKQPQIMKNPHLIVGAG